MGDSVAELLGHDPDDPEYRAGYDDDWCRHDGSNGACSECSPELARMARRLSDWLSWRSPLPLAIDGHAYRRKVRRRR